MKRGATHAVALEQAVQVLRLAVLLLVEGALVDGVVSVGLGAVAAVKALLSQRLRRPRRGGGGGGSMFTFQLSCMHILGLIIFYQKKLKRHKKSFSFHTNDNKIKGGQSARCWAAQLLPVSNDHRLNTDRKQ